VANDATAMTQLAARDVYKLDGGGAETLRAVSRRSRSTSVENDQKKKPRKPNRKMADDATVSRRTASCAHYYY